MAVNGLNLKRVYPLAQGLEFSVIRIFVEFYSLGIYDSPQLFIDCHLVSNNEMFYQNTSHQLVL